MDCVKTRTTPYYPMDSGQTEGQTDRSHPSNASSLPQSTTISGTNSCHMACSPTNIFTARLAASLYNTQTPIKNTKNASEIAWLMGRPINQAIQSGFTNPTLPHTKLDDLHSGPFVVVQSRPNIAYRTRPVSDLFAFPLTVLFNRLKPGLGKTYNTDTEDLTWEADIPVHHTVEFPHNTPPPQQHRGQCFSEQRGSVTHTTFHVIEHYSCLVTSSHSPHVTHWHLSCKPKLLYAPIQNI
uniref:Uncharacterized protein n=1 Tax=Mesocestoides corti TaxID=53468 RepID=A0A5K3ELN3_MESCO